MKILLANISYPLNYKEGRSTFSSGLNKLMTGSLLRKPLNLQILAACTPKEHSIEIKEWCSYQDMNFNRNYDLVGLSCTTEQAIETYKIADEFQRQGKTVIVGGWHASALPEEAKQHADSVVIGEAEETWPQILKDFKNKNLKLFYFPEKPVDPKNIPILKNFSKKEKHEIQAARGCPHGCDFCAITNSKFRNIYRPRPIEDVIEEIKSMKNTFYTFYDNSLTIEPEYTKQLFKEMKGLDIKFDCSGNINVLGRDEELLKVAREAGCIGWFVGFESVSQKSLDGICKKTNKVKDYVQAAKKIHDFGMHLTGSFMFGFDDDTKEIFNDTVEAIYDIEIDMPHIYILTPLPGTPIFDRLEKEGRILTKDWSKYTFENVVFQPKGMSREELFNNTKRVIDELYTYSNIIKRTMKSAKLPLYPFIQTLQANIQNRNEYKRGIIGKDAALI